MNTNIVMEMIEHRLTWTIECASRNITDSLLGDDKLLQMSDDKLFLMRSATNVATYRFVNNI